MLKTNYNELKMDSLKEELNHEGMEYVEFSSDTVEIYTDIDKLRIFVTVNGIYQLQICEGINEDYEYNYNCNVFSVETLMGYIRRILYL